MEMLCLTLFLNFYRSSNEMKQKLIGDTKIEHLTPLLYLTSKTMLFHKSTTLTNFVNCHNLLGDEVYPYFFVIKTLVNDLRP